MKKSAVCGGQKEGMVEYEQYFKPVIEFGALIRAYHASEGEQKAALAFRIEHSEFVRQFSQNQVSLEVDVLNKITCQTQRIKQDFIVNMAVPGRDMPDEETAPQMPYHRHNYMELVYVLRGRYVQYINGIRHEHSAGEFCLLNPNVVHRDAVSGKQDVVLFFCMSPNYVYNDLAAYFVPHPELKSFMEYKLGRSSRQYVLFHPAPALLAEAEEVMEQVLRENFSKKPGHHIILRGLVVRLFSLLVREGGYSVYFEDPAKTSEGILLEITQYIRCHPDQSSRKEVAEHFHFSPDYLNRLVTQATGRCYTAYARDLVLERAAERLLHSGQSVRAILQELGFSNRGYFNRIFTEKYGVLPGKYRMDNRIE